MKINVDFNYDREPFSFEAEQGFRFKDGDVLMIQDKRHVVTGTRFVYGSGGMRGGLYLSQTIYVE